MEHGLRGDVSEYHNGNVRVRSSKGFRLLCSTYSRRCTRILELEHGRSKQRRFENM